jgi:hypothetical protein
MGKHWMTVYRLPKVVSTGQQQWVWRKVDIVEVPTLFTLFQVKCKVHGKDTVIMRIIRYQSS